MKQLVVNADDFGMTRGINRAVAAGACGGVVTSTSLIANGGAFDDAIEALGQCPALGVGLHVNITEGAPLAAAKSSLTDRHGRFYSLAVTGLRLSLGLVAPRDLEAEIRAQAERLVRAGVAISHFDSHENIHLHPRMAPAMLAVAQQMNVRWIRFSNQRPILPWMLREAGLLSLRDHARHLLATAGARRLERPDSGARSIVGAPQLLRAGPRQIMGALLRSLDDGVTEWVCHPGYADADLRNLLPERAAQRREDELKLLADPGSRARFESAAIELINYAQLSG